MNVLFIHPSQYLNNGIPSGIATLGAILKRHGHTVRVFDTTFLKRAQDVRDEPAPPPKGMVYKSTAYTLEDLVRDDPVVDHHQALQEMVDAFQPQLIALSVMTPAFDRALDLMAGIRHEAKVVVGGVHPTIALEDCLNQPLIDMACVGEGDLVLPQLCDRMAAGRDYTDLPSLGFRMADGTIRANPLMPRITDLDSLPAPDWSLFDQRHLFRPYDGQIYNGGFYSSSRGCPMKCTYCVDETIANTTGGHRGYFRTQSPGITAAHIGELKQRYDATWFKFVDDTFLMHPLEHLEELRDLIKPMGIRFGCSVMPNTITREKVALAREMGCVAMSVGVESGNPEIRIRVKRRYDDEALVKRLAIIKDHGIRISTFNMIGFPGETRENVFETVRLNRRLQADACNVYILYPYPGTAINREFGMPLRDETGRIPGEDQASRFGLSAMPAAELHGLQRTFNLYLMLPESLWPVVRLAERDAPSSGRIHALLSELALAVRSGTGPEGIAFATLSGEHPESDDPADDFAVPALFAELAGLLREPDQRAALFSALRATYRRP